MLSKRDEYNKKKRAVSDCYTNLYNRQLSIDLLIFFVFDTSLSVMQGSLAREHIYQTSLTILLQLLCSNLSFFLIVVVDLC